MGRVVKLILYYFCYQFLFQGLGMFIYWAWSSYQFGGVVALESTLSISMSLFWGLLGTVANIIHLVHYRYITLNRTTFATGSMSTVAIYIPMGIAFLLFFNCINDWLNFPDVMEQTFSTAKDSLWGIIAICMGAPLFEEFLFRGAIQGHLQRIWNHPRLAILASAFLFGLVHGNPAQISFAFLFGLVIGELYYRTGSLMPGIILHFINNTVSLLLMHLYPEATRLDELIPPTTYWMLAVIALGVGLGLYYLFLQQVKQATPSIGQEPESGASA
ncbi:MAG: lysostaphin resistance A-like protein [Phocaeicola sp.]